MAKPSQTNIIGYTDNKYSTNIYNQVRILDFDDHRKKKKRFRNSDLHWEQIPRANDPSKPLQDKAVNLLAVIVHKLNKNEVIVLNHNYLSRITKCKKDQNVNLLKQLADVLDISFYTKTIINGKIHRNCYVIKHTEKGRAIIENPEILLAQKHFVGTRAVTPIKKTTQEDKKDSSSAEFFRSSSIYKEKVFKNNRSNESKFFGKYNNSDSLIQPKSPANKIPILVETKKTLKVEKENIEKGANQKATIYPLKQNKPYLSTKTSNQRKKPTNAQNKAKKAKLLRFKQYDQPKNLFDHYPLTTADASELQRKSDREFTLNAQNQILLSLSRKTELQDRTFCSKAQFISYMGKVLKFEKRDAVKIANENYRIKANLTEEQKIENTTFAQREAYLAKVEDKAITHRNDETQFRAKLVGTLGPNLAYDILIHLSDFYKHGEVFEMIMRKDVELTELSKDIILSQVNAVGGYSGTERLEIILTENKITIDNMMRIKR